MTLPIRPVLISTIYKGGQFGKFKVSLDPEMPQNEILLSTLGVGPPTDPLASLIDLAIDDGFEGDHLP